MACYPILDFAPKLAVHFRDVGGIDLGHSYKAVRQPNGDYTIKDLDVFKACQRKNNATGKIDDFSEEWMSGAVQRFEELKRSGYLPPCHLDHHGKEGFSQPPAGQIGALRLGKAKDNVPTLFADIVNIPPEVMAQMLKGRLAYRSVEVNNPDLKEISSLAFMATTVPYHKLPILQLDLDDNGKFSGETKDRVLFAELYSLDPKAPRRAIVQKFYGDYQAFGTPTAAMRHMDRGGDPRMRGDQDGDEQDLQLSDEDFAQLLPYLQQQGGGGEMGGGVHQNMPGDMQGDPMEEMMGNPQLAQAMMSTLQDISTGVQAILKGAANTTPAPITPNPVSNAEPKKAGQQFAETPVATDAQAQLTAQAATLKNLQGLVDKQGELIYALFAERKRDEMHAAFRQAAIPHLQSFYADLSSKAKFSEENADKYMAEVEARFNEKTEQFIEDNLDLAMSKDPKANDWRKVDISKFFAQERGVLPALVDSAKQTFSEPVKPTQVAQGGSAVPRSTTEAAKPAVQATDADAKAFLESLSGADQRLVSRAFSEKPAEAKTALSEARNAWNAMTPAQREYHQNFNDYAAKMVHFASNGSVVVHG